MKFKSKLNNKDLKLKLRKSAYKGINKLYKDDDTDLSKIVMNTFLKMPIKNGCIFSLMGQFFNKKKEKQDMFKIINTVRGSLEDEESK